MNNYTRYITMPQISMILANVIMDNKINIDSVSVETITGIYNKYQLLYIQYKDNYNKNELDAFENAACLLIAIAKSNISENKHLNSTLALEAAIKLCETPYSFTQTEDGEIINNITMKYVNINDAFKKDIVTYTRIKAMLIDALKEGKLTPFNYYLNLKALYEAALEKQNKNTKRISLK